MVATATSQAPRPMPRIREKDASGALTLIEQFGKKSDADEFKSRIQALKDAQDAAVKARAEAVKVSDEAGQRVKAAESAEKKAAKSVADAANKIAKEREALKNEKAAHAKMVEETQARIDQAEQVLKMERDNADKAIAESRSVLSEIEKRSNDLDAREKIMAHEAAATRERAIQINTAIEGQKLISAAAKLKLKITA